MLKNKKGIGATEFVIFMAVVAVVPFLSGKREGYKGEMSTRQSRQMLKSIVTGEVYNR